MSKETKTFIYPSLPTSTSTRLLTLLPGSRHSPLSGRLASADLPNHPAFEALSYEWRSAAESYSLDLGDGVQLPIRRNLRDALLQLRYENKPRTLWIDALCINQADNEEKDMQVRRMKDIYESAFMVIAWLGPEDEGIHESMTAACIIHRYYSQAATDKRLVRKHDEICYDGVSCAEPAVIQPEEKDWNNAALLLQRSYFTRLWIVQELVVARRVVVACGAHSFNFKCCRDLVVGAFENSRLKGQHLHVAQSRILNMDSIAPLLLQYDMMNEVNDRMQFEDLPWLLWRTRNSHCFDARDKVFAILNIASARSISSVAVDYTLDLEAVYTQSARCSLEGDMCSNVFEELDYPRISSHLPSWVPDWRAPNNCEIRIRGCHQFDCPGLGKFYSRPPFLGFPSSGSLALRGISISRIEAMQQESTDHDLDAQYDVLDLTRSFELASTIAVDGKYPHCLQSIEHAYFRTRLADSWVKENEGRELLLSDLDDLAPLWREDSQSNFFVIKPNIISELQSRSAQHCFFVASQNTMGLCPLATLPRDLVYMVIGCSMPLVLRPDEQTGVFRLIGVCYLHGFMNGEWLRELAIQAKSNKGLDDIDFEDFYNWWTEDEQLLDWTEQVLLI